MLPSNEQIMEMCRAMAAVRSTLENAQYIELSNGDSHDSDTVEWLNDLIDKSLEWATKVNG